MTLRRLIELYQAEQQGKQIMVRIQHFGYYNSYEHTEEVKIAEYELEDLIINEQENKSYTYFIKDEENKYGCKL